MKTLYSLILTLLCITPLYADENFVITYGFNNTMSPDVKNYTAFTANDALAGGTGLYSPVYVNEGATAAWQAGIKNNNPNFSQTYVRFDIQPRFLYNVKIDSVLATQKHSVVGGAYNFVVGTATGGAIPTEITDRIPFTADYSSFKYSPPLSSSTSQNGDLITVWLSARGLNTSTSLWYIDEVKIYGTFVESDQKPTVEVSVNKKQQIRLGVDAERLWYWRSGIKDQLAQAAVGELKSDFVRVDINCAYEREIGVIKDSAYIEILEVMTAMRKANPSINFFASPRPLHEAYSSNEKKLTWGHTDNVPWSPYPAWILQWEQNGTKTMQDGTVVPNWVMGYFDYPALTRYFADYLNFMHLKGFNIRYLDLSNEQRVITPEITKYIYDHLPPLLNSGVELPGFIVPSTWNIQGGIDWLNSVNQSNGEHLAFEIAAVHNTNSTGSIEEFATKSHALNKEAWNTELHEWVGVELHDEIMNSTVFWEYMRAGFTGIDTWLFYGPGVGKPHSMIWAYTNHYVTSGKYEIIKQVVNKANLGNYVEISQPMSSMPTAAFVKDNTLSVWLLNKTTNNFSNLDFNLTGWQPQGSVEVMKWHKDLPKEGVQSSFTIGSDKEFKYNIDGESLYFFKINVANNTATSNLVEKNDFVVSAKKETILIKSQKEDLFHSKGQYAVISMQGQLLKTGNLTGSETIIRSKELKSGCYIVSINGNKTTSNHKILLNN
ncbi:MAG: T9SS type A sorting domain-containing protein [Dysgonomonas sp.]